MQSFHRKHASARRDPYLTVTRNYFSTIIILAWSVISIVVCSILGHEVLAEVIPSNSQSVSITVRCFSLKKVICSWDNKVVRKSRSLLDFTKIMQRSFEGSISCRAFPRDLRSSETSSKYCCTREDCSGSEYLDNF